MVRGAQGHRCERRLQTGQPVNGRGHSLKGERQRLGTGGQEKRGGFSSLRIEEGVGRGVAGKRMESGKLQDGLRIKEVRRKKM